MYYVTRYDSPLGSIGLACSDAALVALWLPGQCAFASEVVMIPAPDGHPILNATARWLDRYFAGENPDPREIPLDPEGTGFRKLVWQFLQQIPYGKTATYGDLARQAAAMLGRERMSAQAIGGAVGSNPIAILIPCHRCLGAGGTLTGYAGGLHLKRALLDLENIPYQD